MGLSGHTGRLLTPCQSQWGFLVLVNQIMPLLSSQASDGFHHCQNKPKAHTQGLCVHLFSWNVLQMPVCFTPLCHSCCHSNITSLTCLLCTKYTQLCSFSALFFIILMATYIIYSFVHPPLQYMLMEAGLCSVHYCLVVFSTVRKAPGNPANGTQQILAE